MLDQPGVKFQHIWAALMNVMGNGHRALYRRNKAIIGDIQNLMKGR